MTPLTVARTRYPETPPALAPRHAIAVLLASSLLAIVGTWPVAARLSSRIPPDPGDPILNTWILWWNAEAVPFTERWWNAPAMVPLDGSLALSEHLLGLSVFATPMQWAGASPLVAYNLSFLLSYALSAVFAYALVYRLTGSVAGAACAGLAFGFAPYRAGQLAHIQVLTSQWMPVMLLGMHGYVESGRRRWLLIFGAAWLLQALSNGYYFLFLPALIVPWILWFVPWRQQPRRGVILVTAWCAASLPLVPLLWNYATVHRTLGLSRSLGDIRQFSATWESFTHPPPLLAFWPPGNGASQEDYLFPGITVVALTLGALLFLGARRAVHAVRRTSKLPAGPRLDGMAGNDLGGALVFYAAAAVWMFVLALGPGGAPDGPPSYLRPYAWLLVLPGFDGLRVPARFAMPGIACLSVAAGLAVAMVPTRGARRALLAAAALAGLIADGAVERVPMSPPPPRLNLAGIEGAAVLEIPPDDPRVSVAAMYRSISHRQPLVNGYSGHTPPHYAVLSLALWRGDTSVLPYLARDRPLAIVVNQAADPGGGFLRMMEGVSGAVHVSTSSVGPVFVLPRSAERPAPPLKAVAATGSPGGDRRVVLDTGALQLLAGLGFPIRGRYRDLPERLLIESSEDGREWRQAWLGWTGAHALDAALRQPRVMPMRIAFPPVRARYLRVYPAPGWLSEEAHALTPLAGATGKTR